MNVHNVDKNTALDFAANYGRLKCVSTLLRPGADVNARDTHGYTALMTAAGRDHFDCIKILIGAGADVNIRCQSQRKTIMKATHKKDKYKYVEEFIRTEANVNARSNRSNQGNTALYVAASKGHYQCMMSLIQAGADVNVSHAGGVTPLMRVALKGHDKNVEELIKMGANVNASDGNGITALMNAAESGSYICLNELIEAGADVNASTSLGTTALLFLSSEQNRTNSDKCVEALIEAGANVNCVGKVKTVLTNIRKVYLPRPPNDVQMSVKDAGITLTPTFSPDTTYTSTFVESDFSPLMMASFLQRPNCVSLLLKAGTDVNQRGSLGTTALFQAIKYASEHCVKILLEAGADVNTGDIHGTTALGYAAYYDRVRLIETFIKSGANVNTSGDNGITPLFLAAQAGHIDCLEELLYSGADVNAKTRNGFTPLMQTILAGHVEGAETLILAGANVNTVVRLKRCNDDIMKMKEAAMATVSSYLVSCDIVDELKQCIEEKLENSKSKETRFTPMGLAVADAMEKCIPLLVEAEANVNVSSDVKSPLVCAADLGKPKHMDYLIRAGADVNYHDHYGITALHAAVRNRHINCVSKLVKAGGDVNQRNINGYTPLMTAVQNDSYDCAVKFI